MRAAGSAVLGRKDVKGTDTFQNKSPKLQLVEVIFKMAKQNKNPIFE